MYATRSYATHRIPVQQYGFPQYGQPMQRTAYNQPGGSVSTGPGQPTPSPLQQYGPAMGSLGLKAYMNSDTSGYDPQAYDAALKNNFGLDDPAPGAITDADRIQFGQEMGGTQPGYYTGPQGAAASTEALDASSPYAASNLPAAGADAGATAGTTGAATGTATGTAAATDAGLLGTTTAYASPEAAAAAGQGAADAGLLGGLDASAGIGTGAADAGLLGGAAAGGEAAAAGTAAGEGTAAAVGATNFWNPVGWAALAGLAAYQMGLFD